MTGNSLGNDLFARDSNIEALESLRWVLAQAEQGFFIFTADSAEAQRDVVRSLRTENMAVFDYASTEERSYSYGALEEWASQHRNEKAYFVINLQLVLAKTDDFYNLNLSRDMLSRHGKIWIFGMTKATDNKLAIEAVDFYSFVRVRACFEEENPIHQTETIHFESEPGMFASVQEARERLNAYAEMEKRYLNLDPDGNTPKGELFSAASTLANIADAYLFIGEYGNALQCAQKALEIREKVLGKEHPDTATIYNNLAFVYRHQGNYAKALEMYQKALAICEKVLGKEHPNTATTYNNIAVVYSKQGLFNEALKYYEKALYVREKALGKEHPETGATYNNIVVAYSGLGDYAKALMYSEKAVEIFENVFGKNLPATADAYNTIAVVYGKLKEYTKAIEYSKKALAIRENVLGEEHPLTLVTMNNLASLLADKGDAQSRQEAEALKQKIKDIENKTE